MRHLIRTEQDTTMLRIRLAQAAAVATIAVGSAVLIPAAGAVAMTVAPPSGSQNGPSTTPPASPAPTDGSGGYMVDPTQPPIDMIWGGGTSQ
jgi:hypothetical protein